MHQRVVRYAAALRCEEAMQCVQELTCVVGTATPGVEFDLNMSFPRKKLDDKSQSIEAAQLQNAALTQSLK